MIQLRPVRKLHVLLRKVKLQFDKRRKADQLLAELTKLPREPTTYRMKSGARRSGSMTGDEIGHRLGLCEIELPIQKSPLGKFTGFGQPGARPQKRLDHLFLDIRATMTGDFHHVFPRIAARIAKKRDDNLIELPVAVDQQP